MMTAGTNSEIAMVINIVLDLLIVTVVTMVKLDLHQMIKRIERVEDIFIRRRDHEE